MGSPSGMDQMIADEMKKKQEEEAFQKRAGERGYLEQVTAMARGEGNSAAQIQARQNLAQAMAQSRGMAAAQRGINPALAARQSALAQAGMAQAGMTDAAKLRAQEQMGALGAWGEQISGQRNARTQQLIAHEQAQTARDIEHGRQNAALAGGLIGGVGAALGAFAHGGEIPESQMNAGSNQSCYACGGQVPHMAFGGGMERISAEGSTAEGPMNWKPYGAAMSAFGKQLEKSSQRTSANPQAIIQSAIGYAMGGPVNMMSGGKVPGQGMVPGDSYKNDVVPAMLSPKEIVIPRSIALSENAGEKAKAFVDAVRSKYAESNKKKQG